MYEKREINTATAPDTATDPTVQNLVSQTRTKPFALVLDEHFRNGLDLEAARRIEQHLTRGVAPDHPVIQGERQLMREMNQACFEAGVRFLQQLAEGHGMVRLIDREATHELAAIHGVTNATLGDWRRDQVLKRVKIKPGAIIEEIVDVTFQKEDQATSLLNKMVVSGQLRRDGAHYMPATGVLTSAA